MPTFCAPVLDVASAPGLRVIPAAIIIQPGLPKSAICCASSCAPGLRHPTPLLPRKFTVVISSISTAPACDAGRWRRVSPLTPNTSNPANRCGAGRSSRSASSGNTILPPHRWFGENRPALHLIEIIDDHSRVVPLARLYLRESLLAHLDFLSSAFIARGLPLALYVDYHSFSSLMRPMPSPTRRCPALL